MIHGKERVTIPQISVTMGTYLWSVFGWGFGLITLLMIGMGLFLYFFGYIDFVLRTVYNST